MFFYSRKAIKNNKRLALKCLTPLLKNKAIVHFHINLFKLMQTAYCLVLTLHSLLMWEKSPLKYFKIRGLIFLQHSTKRALYSLPHICHLCPKILTLPISWTRLVTKDNYGSSRKFTPLATMLPSKGSNPLVYEHSHPEQSRLPHSLRVCQLGLRKSFFSFRF